MIQRRQRPQRNPYADSSAFSDLPAEFDRAMPWARDAACRGEDPELFFPTPTKGWKRSVLAKRQRLATAKAICGRCPVVGECLEHAVGIGDRLIYRYGQEPFSRAEKRCEGLVPPGLADSPEREKCLDEELAKLREFPWKGSLHLLLAAALTGMTSIGGLAIVIRDKRPRLDDQ